MISYYKDTLNYDFELINIETEKLENSNDSLDDDLVFIIVEQMPKFGRGLNDFRKYIADNLYYLPRATMYGIKGKVFIQFTVDTTGQVINVNIIDKVDKDIDKEAIRVIHNSPLWKPGEQRGKPVRVQFTVPLNFTFND